MSYLYTKKVDINGNILWKHWIDVSKWHMWQNSLEYAKIEGDFIINNTIKYKLKETSNIIDIKITEFINTKEICSFTDCVFFPLATMISTHTIKMINKNESILELKVETKGILGFLWKFLVINKIIAGMPANLDSFINYVKKINNE